MVVINFNGFSPGDDNPDFPAKVVGTKTRIRDTHNNLDNLQTTLMYRDAVGDFSYDTIAGSKLQRYSMNITNKWDALLFSKLLRDFDNVDKNRLRGAYVAIYDLLEVADRKLIFKQFRDQFAKWFPAINNNQIVNPVTGRNISINAATFRKIMGAIKLRDVTYKLLGNFETVDYPIVDLCVPSWLKYAGISINIPDVPTVKEFSDGLKSINYGHTISLYNNYILIDFEGKAVGAKKKRKMCFISHNGHLYVVKRSKTTVKKVITLNYEEWYDKFYETQEKYDLENYQRDYFVCQGIKYKKKPDYFPEELYNLKFTNNYTFINIDFFKNCGIRPCNFGAPGKIITSLDIDCAYPSQMRNSEKAFIVQTGNEYIKKHNKKELILDHRFYYVSNCNYPFHSNWVMGSSIKKFGLGEVLYVMKGTTVRMGRDFDLDIKDDNKHYLSFLENYPDKNKVDFKNHLYRIYAGMCCRYNSETIKRLDIDCEIEKEAFANEFNGVVHETGVRLYKNYFRESCGYFAWLSIVNHTIDDLYQLHLDVLKHHPSAKLLRLRTDGSSYDCKIGDIDTSIDYKREFGKKQQNCTVSVSNFNFKNYFKKELVEYDFIKNNVLSSMAILGYPGLGKSWFIHNTLVPFFIKNNHKYLITSATIENAKSHNSKNIHQFIKKTTGWDEIVQFFGDYKVIVIDECSQLTTFIMFILQKLKKLGICIILCGDDFQCEGIDGDVINTNYLNGLVDYKVTRFIKWHDKCRFTEEYFNFLVEFKNCTHMHKRFSLLDKLQKVDVSVTNINIAYYNKKHPKAKKFYISVNASTVHFSQGKTIDEDFTIHQLAYLPSFPHKVAYTALSRGKDFSNVFLCTKKFSDY